MRLTFDTSSMEDYERFLRVKSLPTYRVIGHTAEFPDEYAAHLSLKPPKAKSKAYVPAPWLHDYQAGIAGTAIRKRKFAIFAEPGRGKTLMQTEWLRHAGECLPQKKKLLMVAPLMVVRQTIEEVAKFYGNDFRLEQVHASGLQAWLDGAGERFGITNFESIRKDIKPGLLGALDIDESGIMKSAYGTYGRRLIYLGRGLEWKLCATGTPAPNDRIEYGSHAVFLDRFPNINSFLSRYFVNRGQTNERWELKPHALRPFYRDLSHWCIFLSNPATYGWKDGTDDIPPIHVHIEDVPLTAAQRDAVYRLTGQLIVTNPGGITTRTKMAQIAKGSFAGQEIETLKYEFIRDRVASWPDESTIIWCEENDEQSQLEKQFPEGASIKGTTKYERRLELINDFKAGRRPELITKPKILGFGLNLQVATRQGFSSLQDSYEKYWQCLKRSNRIGSTRDLNAHIFVTEIEQPMVETVIRKARRVDQDTREQEEMFKDASYFAA